MRGLPLLLLLLPVAELAVLIQVGSEIGVFAVLGLLLLGGVLGLQVLGRQGFANLGSARRSLDSGTDPGQELLEGLLRALAGVLLLIPGFLTDLVALPLLLPWTRRALVRRWLRNGSFRAFGSSGFTVFHTRSGGRHGQRQRGSIYEGEIVEDEVLHESRPDSQLQGPSDRDKNS